MLKYVSLLIIFLFFTSLLSCERNVQLSPKVSRFIASEYLKKIDGNEKFPPAIKDFLYQEQEIKSSNSILSGTAYAPEKRAKFPLPYYLVSKEDAKFYKTKSLDPRIADQLFLRISGSKHYKLFVHPKMESTYDFLRASYNYIGPDKTEFMASPTSSGNSLVVWNKNNTQRKVFIVKVNLSNVPSSSDSHDASNFVVGPKEVERSIANQNVFDQIGKNKLDEMNLKIFPETAGLVMTKMPPRAPTTVGAQIIREIPDEIIENQNKWIPLSALKNLDKNNSPIILNIIAKSGLNSYQFFESYMIDSYLKMYEAISLKSGINFIPKINNLLIETTNEFKPTGKWALREFDNIWPKEANVKKLELKTGRINCIESYVVSYKDQIFDALLTEVAKDDAILSEEKIQSLKNKINRRYTKLINQYYGLKAKDDIIPNNFKALEKEFIEQSAIDENEMHKEIKDFKNLKTFLQNKKDSIEWLELSPRKGNSEFYLTNHALYEVSEKKIVALALLNKNERDEYNTVAQTGCYVNISSFFHREK